MMRYGQFCPIAKAAEIVAERWTPLVIHELLAGSTRFNDIRRGVPLMSPTLLSTRLKELQRAGIVQRRAGGNRGHEWHLTEAGLALGPLIRQLGEWGLQYAHDPLEEGDLDVTVLTWNMRRRVDPRLSRTAHHRLFRIHRRAEKQGTVVGCERSGKRRSLSKRPGLSGRSLCDDGHSDDDRHMAWQADVGRRCGFRPG